MIKASRFLSSSEDVTKKSGAAAENAAQEDVQKSNNVTGRPGQVFVKVKKAVNLPTVSGQVHRFVELEYSGKCNFIIYSLMGVIELGDQVQCLRKTVAGVY